MMRRDAPRPQASRQRGTRRGHDPYRPPDDVPYDRTRIREGTDRWETNWREQQRPRRRGSVGRTIRRILLVALVGALVGAGLLWVRVAAFNDRVSTASALSSALFLPLNGSDRVNVLMLGYGGAEHEGGFLADSISILSVDAATDETAMIAIPRDLWIEGVGALPQNGKVNEAFAIGYDQGGLAGGAELLADALSEVTGLEIDHWMAIDFDGFREMVDAVGGVTIQNPAEFSYTGNEQLHQSSVWADGTFAAGEIQLDGAQALAYARARYTSVIAESSDFARSLRQARIIAALKGKLGDGGLGSLGPGLRLMSALEERLTTDLSAIDLFLMSGNLSTDRRVALLEDVILRATTNTDGQYVLIPIDWTGPGDYGGLHAFIADALVEPLPETSPDSVTGAP